MSRPLVFISYSHEDEKQKDQLLSHLRVLQRAGLRYGVMLAATLMKT